LYYVGIGKGKTIKAREVRMSEARFSWNMLWMVCAGRRNFGTKNAIAVGELTNTDPMMWKDDEKKQYRMRYMKEIEGNFGANKPRVENPKKRGRKPKSTG
jgi:hypothetical protein